MAKRKDETLEQIIKDYDKLNSENRIYLLGLAQGLVVATKRNERD